MATNTAIRVYDPLSSGVRGAQDKDQDTLNCSFVENTAFIQSIGVDNIVRVEAWDTTGDFSVTKFAFDHSIATPGVTASYLKVDTDDLTFSTATEMEIYSVLESDQTNIKYILLTLNEQIVDFENVEIYHYVVT